MNMIKPRTLQTAALESSILQLNITIKLREPQGDSRFRHLELAYTGALNLQSCCFPLDIFSDF